eukprot:TRINITY_DN3458_c0_g1_i8.p3 TRINITY_DN3458_c0_g1~~TRINITY_DN3458_c0_g1_i8.p3  ORF type:complete len:203 (-),score=-17.91 TRINITY_DN3458_c0_g1_i8:700-1308(-)
MNNFTQIIISYVVSKLNVQINCWLHSKQHNNYMSKQNSKEQLKQITVIPRLKYEIITSYFKLKINFKINFSKPVSKTYSQIPTNFKSNRVFLEQNQKNLINFKTNFVGTQNHHNTMYYQYKNLMLHQCNHQIQIQIYIIRLKNLSVYILNRYKQQYKQTNNRQNSLHKVIFSKLSMPTSQHESRQDYKNTKAYGLKLLTLIY